MSNNCDNFFHPIIEFQTKMKRKFEEEENSNKRLKPTFQFENQMNKLEIEEEEGMKLILNYFLEFSFEISEFEGQLLEEKIKLLLNHKNEYIQILSLKLLGKIYLKIEPNFEILKEKLKTNLTIQTLEVLISLHQQNRLNLSNQENEELFMDLKEFLLNWDQQIRKSNLELLSYISIKNVNLEEISIILLESFFFSSFFKNFSGLMIEIQELENLH